MVKYGKNKTFIPEKLDTDNIDRQSIALIPKGAKVLEIGCATGFMGVYLQKKKDCTVIGVELGVDEARIAKKNLTGVIQADIEDKTTLKKIASYGKFDVIFSSALIEHLKDPWTSLKQWKKFINKNGSLILTTSNVAHWSMRLKLFQGKFDYEQFGILDNTHLRFFTTNSFRKLVEDCGYSINHFAIDAVGGGYPKISKPLSTFFPNVFAYQMVILANPK